MAILVIEDDPNSLDLIRTLIRSVVNFECDLADSISNAEWLIKKSKPDLVIMDLLMHGDLSVYLIDLINSLYSEVPILITSAYYHYKTALHGHKYDTFFMKPYNVHALREKIKSFFP